jgi:hypothetical protein
MRWIVGGRAATKQAASTSQMGRFETEWLANDENLVALADLGGRWIDRVHSRRPLNGIVLDMDSSVSETYGDQEGTAYNGHFACTCYHPLFVFNQFGDLERCALRSGNVHSAHGRQLRLSGGKLEDTAPRGGQGRVAPGRALSPRWLHRHQLVAPGRRPRRQAGLSESGKSAKFHAGSGFIWRIPVNSNTQESGQITP